MESQAVSWKIQFEEDTVLAIAYLGGREAFRTTVQKEMIEKFVDNPFARLLYCEALLRIVDCARLELVRLAEEN